MRKVYYLLPLYIIIFCFFSCLNNNETRQTGSDFSTNQQVDSTYMPTGFYFLTNKENDGVKMKEEDSNKIYILSRKPFASVNNVKQTQLQTTKLEQGDYTELCMTFDSKGTKDLEEGTGNPAHPQIAVVVVGKLLYVVNNTAKIKTGVMCVGLLGYSDEDMKSIKLAVDKKL